LPLPQHLQPWANLLDDHWPADAGPIPDQRALHAAVNWITPGERSGLAIVMYCRPDGASNAEVIHLAMIRIMLKRLVARSSS
jgi:hypothetical protein